MNYIHTLEQKVRERDAYIASLCESLTDLEQYLQSEKFWEDTTVQVNDVLRRLHNAMYYAYRAKEDA